VFGIIEMAKLIGRLPRTEPNEIEECSQAIRTVLAETVECSCEFPLDAGKEVSPPQAYCDLVQLFIQRGASRIANGAVSFITFNYDIGLDYALHWTSHPIDYALSGVEHNAIPLYKLHGSLNWALCSDNKTVKPVELRTIVAQSSPPKYFAESEPFFHYLRPTQHLSSVMCPGTSSVVGPAIVPPTWNKTQYHSIFSSIWQRAAAEISVARRIYVVGYSAARSDSFFKDLLALGLAGNANLREFTVIDPIPSVREQIYSLLGPAGKKAFNPVDRTFESWLEQVKHSNTFD
jgi:hypothetical protein